MVRYFSAFHVMLPDGSKLFTGDQARCSYKKGESSGCWHGKINSITSRGIYIDVGNKRDKYVCFVDITELSLVV